MPGPLQATARGQTRKTLGTDLQSSSDARTEGHGSRARIRLLALLLLTVGLWNATLPSSEKGFYAMAYLLSLFGSVAVQKNVRDIALYDKGSTGFAEGSGSLES